MVRTGRISRERTIVKPSAFRLLPALAAVVALALFALSYTSTGETRSQHGSWQWERALTGSPVAANGLTRRLLDISPGRGWTSLREVAAAGSMSDRVSLLAVRSHSGDVCLGVGTVEFARKFSCVSTNSAVRDEPLLHFMSGGGARLGVVDRVSVVGIARSDVARVVVTTASGQHELHVNNACGFAYDSAAEGLPSSISAYRADGALIAVYPVGM
jgi:hypothetical protein